mgnify:CR=1 FL=1
MKIKKGLQAEVEITDVAFGGRGLVRLDGLAVFVDQAVPGDRVILRIFRKKKNYAEAAGHFQAALRADPDFKPARHNLNKAIIALNNNSS